MYVALSDGLYVCISQFVFFILFFFFFWDVAGSQAAEYCLPARRPLLAQRALMYTSAVIHLLRRGGGDGREALRLQIPAHSQPQLRKTRAQHGILAAC